MLTIPMVALLDHQSRESVGSDRNSRIGTAPLILSKHFEKAGFFLEYFCDSLE